MTGDDQDDMSMARVAVVDARRDAAIAQARLAEAAVRYADARVAGDTAAGVGSGRRRRAKPGEFVADELALLLREQPYAVRCLVGRARRMTAGLPTVWEAFRRGELDADQMRVIDRVARRVTETATLAALDEQAVEAAQARSPKQLQVWLLRLVVQLEPLAFAERHRRASAERRVTVMQGTDGIGYVTGEVSAADAADRRTARRDRSWPGRGGSADRPEDEEDEDEADDDELRCGRSTLTAPARGLRLVAGRRDDQFAAAFLADLSLDDLLRLVWVWAVEEAARRPAQAVRRAGRQDR